MKTIYTVGYEGTDIGRFVKTLLAVGIEVVADVRALPLSRKKGFSKNSLREHLQCAGIGYLPYQELGDPKPGREAAKAGRYSEFRKIYSAHIETDKAAKRVDDLADTAAERVTCMLCFERDPATCHRSIVAEKLASHGFASFDLYADDPDRYSRNRHLLPTNLVAAE
jgi:uncharacterized protein (DUF488 family)